MAIGTILIVDDEPDIRELLKALLDGMGYDARTAANGLEALAQMRLERPCLILLDINMPVMNGIEFRRAQLREPSLASVPVVFVTAVPNQALSVDFGPTKCLTKPVAIEHLLDVIREFCGTSRAGLSSER